MVYQPRWGPAVATPWTPKSASCLPLTANCWPETCEAILAGPKTQDPRRLPAQLSRCTVCAMSETENQCPHYLLPATVAHYGFHSSVQKVWRDGEGKFHFRFSQCEIATGQMIEYVVALEHASITREAHPHRLVLPPDPPAKRTRTGL